MPEIVEVSLAKGRGVALIDAEDAERVLSFQWYRHETNGGYYARSSSGYLHRLILGLEKGDGLSVDHIDGNTLDNRRANLRVLTHAQNQQNRHRQRNRRSQYRGVSWWSTRGVWTVRCKVNGVTHYGGHYRDEHEAGVAARDLRERLMPYSTT